MKWMPELLLGSVFVAYAYWVIHSCIHDSRIEMILIHFTKGESADIPSSVFMELFTLPPKYVCSWTYVFNETNRSVYLKTFIARCSSHEFLSFLYSIFHVYCKILESYSENSKDITYETVYKEHSDCFSRLKISQNDFEPLWPLLQRLHRNKDLRNWLISIIKKGRVNHVCSSEDLKNWNSSFQFVHPVVFLDNLTIESNEKRTEISYIAFQLENQSRDSGYKYFSTTCQVNCCYLFYQQCDSKQILFKHFNVQYSVSNMFDIFLPEFSVFQQRQIISLGKYNAVYSIVVKSSSDPIPIGYLIKNTEYGNLTEFLQRRPDIILTKYFINQLFELAKAINILHSHDILHLDIRTDNVYVRKVISENSTNDENDYELIIDFGLSAMRGLELRCYGDFKNMVKIYPPELLNGVPCNNRRGTRSDWYEFGKMLSFVATNIKNPEKRVFYLCMFLPLTNGVSTFHIKKRWNFTDIEKHFKDVLENYNENKIFVILPYNNEGVVLNCVYRPTNTEPDQDCYNYIPEYKLCKFQSTLYIVNSSNPNLATEKHASEARVHITWPIIYEFQQDYPLAIGLLQTKNQKTYFFKGDVLFFQPDVFCYVEFYDKNDENDKVVSTIATYNYLDVIKAINADGIQYITRIE